ncbi:M15 family metallopeptidase [Fluoribacter gormanii]|uniref:M15 family metallopeptidase n=1 Tax=Fluoribacter gormanii TaxID=464 RepID=UPI0010415750|nr:M15 family metallopeptidase [Fluoribacter gormanii]
MSDNTIQDSILLIADPKIVAIPVIENHDPMIDLVNHPEIIYGPSPEIPNNTDYTKMRKTVYEKLNQAQSLLPKGLRFCLYESYRSLALQKFLFDTRYGKVKNKHPEWSSEQIFTETTRLVSPVINLDGSPNIPPHSTGAAIDVYLINDQGEAIDMGIHPKDWMEDLDGSLSLTASEIITDEAKQNRKIMCHVLETVGFVNYRNEYWHWSYGDRYWAYYKQQPYACYDNYK